MGIVLYGLDPKKCQACDIAAGVLMDRGVPFKYVDINTTEEIFNKFSELHDKVPQVYENGVHVGGAMAVYSVGEVQ